MGKNRYIELKEKNIECWNLIEKAINDLIENNDLKETTRKRIYCWLYSAMYNKPLSKPKN